MFNWYAIQAISGHEQKVKGDIMHRLQLMEQLGRLRKIVIPTESAIVEQNGKKVQKEQRTLPGYILIEAELTDDAWVAIRHTPGVLSFVGAGGQPTPLTRAEVAKMLGQNDDQPKKQIVEFAPGDRIEVRSGPMAGLEGDVVEVNTSTRRLKATLMIFERPTSIDLDFEQAVRR